MSASEVDKFFAEGLDWKEFGKKYPNSGGFFVVSRAGFSKDNNQALVFVARFCGTACGAGDHHFLMKTNGEWKLIKTKVAWVV